MKNWKGFYYHIFEVHLYPPIWDILIKVKCENENFTDSEVTEKSVEVIAFESYHLAYNYYGTVAMHIAKYF